MKQKENITNMKISDLIGTSFFNAPCFVGHDDIFISCENYKVYLNYEI